MSPLNHAVLAPRGHEFWGELGRAPGKFARAGACVRTKGMHVPHGPAAGTGDRSNSLLRGLAERSGGACRPGRERPVSGV